MNGWPRVQIRHIARFAYGDSLGADVRSDGAVRVYGSNGVVGTHDRANTAGPVLVIGRKGSYGKVNFSEQPVFAIDTTYFVDASLTSHNLRWLMYALDTVGLDSLSQDVGVPGLSREVAYRERVPLPTALAQRAIADFLDTETARIDALISKKRRLIELLDQRLRLEALTLTVGDWARLPLRRCVESVKTGTTPPSSEFEALQGDQEPWYSPGDVGTRLEMQEPARLLSSRSVSEGWVPRFPAESTVIVGIGATAGRVGHTSVPGTGNQQMSCLIAGPRILGRFLSWQLWARGDEMRATAPHTTLPILNNDFLKSFEVSLPDFRVQESTAAVLDRSAGATGIVTSTISRQVDLLVEHRQALITEAVTGAMTVTNTAVGVGAQAASARG
ncbi:MAG: restriction endonuclease subunit S [Acidimicrobiales bacterium]